MGITHKTAGGALMGFEHISYKRDGALAWITLDRPKEANALSLPLAEEFCAAVGQAESDAGCHVVILQGSGRFFCAGGDVAGMAASEDMGAYLHSLAGKMHEGILALAHSRLIAVAVVHGPAAGAGLGLALNADLVLASSKATFMTAYGAVGLTPDCGVSYLLPEVIGPRRAAEMCLAGRVVTAEEALEWGLINALVPEAELSSRARRLGQQLAGGAVRSLGPSKRLLKGDRLKAYAGHLQDELATISTMASGPEAQELISAFARRGESRVRS